MVVLRAPLLVLRLLAVVVGVIGYLVVVPIVDVVRSLAGAATRLVRRSG